MLEFIFKNNIIEAIKIKKEKKEKTPKKKISCI